MKRYRLEARVQNWHRPLGASDIRQRFHAERHDTPGIVERGRFVWQVSTSCACDASDDWVESDLIKLPEDYWESRWIPSQAQRRFWEVCRICADVVSRAYRCDSRSVSSSHSITTIPLRDSRSTGRGGIGSQHLAERLRSHFELLDRAPGNLQQFADGIRGCGINRKDIEMLQRVRDQEREREAGYDEFAIVLAIIFAPFWIDSPRNFVGSLTIRAMLEHLFVRYPVPEKLYDVWKCYPSQLNDEELGAYEWIGWFILLAQGASLQSGMAAWGRQLPRGFQDRLTRVPLECRFENACMYTEVERLGGSQEDFLLLQGFRGMCWDPTMPQKDSTYASFWYATVRWLIRYRDTLSLAERCQVIAWARHEYTQAKAQGRSQPVWQDKCPKAIWQQVERYDRMCRLPLSLRVWNAQGGD